MYPVTQDFIDKMKADRRHILCRCEIDYTDPFLDQSLTIEASEKANHSYPQQTADSVDQTTRKYACLDGTWDLTSGEYHLAPSANMLSQYQMGWWGAQFADQDGYFAEPYPTLTVTHLPRPIRQLKVVGDTAREEYPVDFTVKLYAQNDTLLKTETVTGNDQVSWSKTLEPQILDVAKQVLEITKWSLPGTCAKIIEFFTSIREVYETGDLVSVKLLEEREASQGSLPVGNISSNEITLDLNNADKKFDLDNENSPLKNLLKPNRRIQAWLGAEAENAAAENPPTFTRNSVAYLSDGTQVAANQPRFEPGKFGKGVLVEEGTTNHHSNPRLATSITGWAGEFRCSLTRTNERAIFGDWSAKIVVGDPAVNWYAITQGDYTFICTPSTVYAFSIWIYSDTSNVGNAKIEINQFRNDNSYIGDVGGLSWTSKKGEWEYLTAIFTSHAEASKLSFRIRGNFYSVTGDTYWVTAAQIEQKPYPTSFTDGTRAAETLTIPTEGVLNPQEGTIECWVYEDGITTKSGFFWDVNRDSFDRPALYRRGGSQYELFWDLGTTKRISCLIPPIGWHYLVVKWAETEIALYLDGVFVGDYTLDNPASDYISDATDIHIGCRYTNTAQLNSLIDDFRISSRARTDEEILAAYQSGQPLERDESTTYLLSFNGSIYPVEQCWVPLGTFWSLDWDSPDDSLEATVTARDRMELLRKGTYQTSQVQQNKSLYELAELVLQDAGLNSSEYVIDTDLQNIIVPYAWFNPISHREALRRIAEAGLAAAFQNRDGKIQIESFLISGDEAVLEITEDDYFPPLRAPSRQDQVANEIIVDTQPLRPAAVAEEVYRSNEPITIPASSTKTVTAFYNQPPVIDATASLDSPPTGVSIIEATYYGWGASIKIQNTTGTDAQVTLAIQGRPLTVQNKERAIARDEASILENGVLRFEFPENPLVQTLAQAQAIADALLASVKEPRRDIEVEWRGNPALLLGDRVTVKGKDYHVIRQELDWRGYLRARLTGRKTQ